MIKMITMIPMITIVIVIPILIKEAIQNSGIVGNFTIGSPPSKKTVAR